MEGGLDPVDEGCEEARSRHGTNLGGSSNLGGTAGPGPGHFVMGEELEQLMPGGGLCSPLGMTMWPPGHDHVAPWA